MNPILTDGILFDVDGTLWDSTSVVADGYNEALRFMGVADIVITAERLKSLFGKTMDVIAGELFSSFAPARQKELMEQCVLFEDQHLRDDPCRILYPGVRETILSLSEKVPLFIVSNCQSGYIELFLEKSSLASCIRDFECYGNTKCTKAENMARISARNHLHHPVYVGDTALDQASANEVSMPFIHAAYGFGTVVNPAASISSFCELTSLFTF